MGTCSAQDRAENNRSRTRPDSIRTGYALESLSPARRMRPWHRNAVAVEKADATAEKPAQTRILVTERRRRWFSRIYGVNAIVRQAGGNSAMVMGGFGFGGNNGGGGLRIESWNQ